MHFWNILIYRLYLINRSFISNENYKYKIELNKNYSKYIIIKIYE